MQRISVFILLLTFFSCNPNSKKQAPAFGNLEKVELKYAKGFNIQKGEGFTIFTVFLSPVDSASFILDFTGELMADIPIIRQPVEKVACLTTTAIPFLEKLGSLNTVVAMSYLQFVKNETVKTMERDGAIFNLGNAETEAELLYSLGSKIVLSGSRGNLPTEQLDKLGIIPVYFTEYNETHPLAKAEWIIFFGTLFNREKEAQELFSQIEKNYLDVKNSQPQTEKKPKILFGYEYQGKWSTPGGASYINQLIEDAGGEYFYAKDKSTGSLYLDMEELLVKSQDISSWMIVSQYSQSPTLGQLAQENKYYNILIEQTKGNVYLCNTLKNKYFEDAILEPDVLLKDFAKAVFPEAYPTHISQYFLKLKNN